MYKPAYATTIRETVSTVCHNTMHTDEVDWENYPFDNPEITANRCCGDDAKKQYVQRLKEYLQICEQFKNREVFASNYGGWPRIWHRVTGVGMGSAWPYWKPRPIVLVSGTLETKWIDWASLTGAECRPPKLNTLGEYV